MAITTNQIYDANRDVYLERERYEREMQLYRMKMEDEFHRHHPYGQAIFGQNAHQQGGQLKQSQTSQAKNQATPDPKDPLAFLYKSDSKLLLTGETL
jgi:hypothetical protein